MTDYKLHWWGKLPHRCDVCQSSIIDEFVDGATVRGPWAIMCPKCSPTFGHGLGVGKGQRYTKQADGRFLKTGG